MHNPETVKRAGVPAAPSTAELTARLRKAATYRDAAQRRLDIRNAVSGVALTGRDEHLLDWLANWDQDTTSALADLIVRARDALQGPIHTVAATASEELPISPEVAEHAAALEWDDCPGVVEAMQRTYDEARTVAESLGYGSTGTHESRALTVDGWVFVRPAGARPVAAS